jgi:cysteine synthase A
MKDRLARTLIERAAASGRLPPGGTVVEYTGGTTGISLAFVAGALGYRSHLVYSDAFSEEKRRTMRAYGAEITDVTSADGKISKELVQAMMARAGEIARRPGHWLADQLRNADGAAGYHGLGEEIRRQTGGRVDAFVHAVGSAHSLNGTSEALRRESAACSSAPSSPRSRRCSRGVRRARTASRASASASCRRTGGATRSTRSSPSRPRRRRRWRGASRAREAIFTGTSTGANVVAALKLAERLGAGATVATLIVDSGLRYLSTDVFRTPRPLITRRTACPSRRRAPLSTARGDLDSRWNSEANETMPDDDRRVFRALIGVASTAVFVSFGTGYAIMDHEAETHADSGRWTKVRDVLALLDFDLQRWSPGPSSPRISSRRTSPSRFVFICPC